MTDCRVLSTGSRKFADRQEAGELLARELIPLRDLHPVVLGIPRGGVAIARELARALDGDLDVVMTHKIVAEGYPELAVGAVTESGDIFTKGMIAPENKGYLQRQAVRQLKALQENIAVYRSVLLAVPLEKRHVIVTDDGVATGFTMEAALWAIRRQQPAKIIAAVPVSADPGIKRLLLYADEVVCLCVPRDFLGVGQFYERFSPFEHEDVITLLEEEAGRRRLTAT